jgi:4-amino-4-deoxy-L-arabinose transferase-like glycosyltransferase
MLNDLRTLSRSRAIGLEAVALAFVIAVALFMRLWRLDAVPPGFHYDEAIDLRQGLRVLAGARPLYVTEGWGREALFYYLTALSLYFIPDKLLALRVTAALSGTGVVLAAYFIARRWAGWPVAWLTAAWLALSYWSVSTSRFGVRNIALPLVFSLAVLAFWWALETGSKHKTWCSRQICRFTVAGFLLGLTLYTYQPARFLPFIFAGFAAYMLLFHPDTFREQRKGWIVFVASAFVTSLFLIITIVASDQVEQDRNFTLEPLTRLRAGDPQMILENVVATLKMFTFAGDPLVSYNVPGRPVFQPPWIGILYYTGFALALWRWRQPLYAFVLLWLFFALLPTVVTLSAPHFNRTIAAQIPVMFLAAIAVVELAHLADRYGRQLGRWVIVALAIAMLVLTARYTWHDYFTTWYALAGKTAQYNANLVAVSRYLDSDPDARPVLISSPYVEDVDPYLLSLTLARTDLVTRWLDTGQALAMPAGYETVRLAATSGRWIDPHLSSLWLMPGVPYYASDRFAVFELRQTQWPDQPMQPLYYLEPGAPWPGADMLPLFNGFPYLFCDCEENADKQVALARVLISGDLGARENVIAVTNWQVLSGGYAGSLAIFAHLLNESGQLVAQSDGLGYPPHTWQYGDRFSQVHYLSVEPVATPGRYWLQLGLYWRETGRRWLVADEPGKVWADRLLLPLTID